MRIRARSAVRPLSRASSARLRRTSLTADDVREFAAGKLAHYKIPRYVHVTGLGVPPLLVFVALRQTLQALGRLRPEWQVALQVLRTR